MSSDRTTSGCAVAKNCLTLGCVWPTSTPGSEPPSDSQQSKEVFVGECLIDVTEQAAPLREALAEHRQPPSDLEQIVDTDIRRAVAEPRRRSDDCRGQLLTATPRQAGRWRVQTDNSGAGRWLHTGGRRLRFHC